jgi:hypothetical protein
MLWRSLLPPSSGCHHTAGISSQEAVILNTFCTHHETVHVGSSGSTSAFIHEVLSSNLGQGTVHPSEDLHGFPQSLQVNSGIEP